MRLISTLPFAAFAAAFVLPDAEVFQQIALEEQDSHHDESSWWSKLPSKDSLVSSFEETLDSAKSGVQDALQSGLDELFDQLESVVDEEDTDIELTDRPRHGHPDTSNYTVYQLISNSKYTTKFAKLVSEYDDLVDLLNSTKANFTLFVPVDDAIKEPPEGKKPSKEFIEGILKYHIGLGFYPAGRVVASHTIPTALTEKFLGGEHQRLRTRFGIRGVTVNFYSKVVYPNIRAKNGFIHAINHVLIPPPMVGRELSLFPSTFSTLLLAYEKTDFVSFIHGQKMNGTTVFAPSNRAFARLGPAANAFLFNTEKGKGYLKALLKYQIVANATLYSDAYYGGDVEDVGNGHWHVDLPTLLGDKSIAVDVARWGAFVRMRVNGYVPVVVQDGIAKNGVVQVVGRVPIPPHKHHKHDSEGEIEVEELMERLEGYLEDGEGEKPAMSEL